MKSKTHIYMANMLIEELKASSSLTIKGIGTFSVPDDIKHAILSQPAAFRAGAVGPDFYPDMVIGQTIIHPSHSGKWLSIMQQKLKAIRRDSPEWDSAYAFYLGYLLHYAGDMFGHDYVNGWARGSFPAITEALSDPEKARIIIRHILIETYMDERVPKDMDMHIQAPISFLYQCFASDECVNLYPAESDSTNLLKMMIALKMRIHQKTQNPTIRTLDICNYFPSWESDIEQAIRAWLVLWNQIAVDFLEPNGMSAAYEHIKQWLKEWGFKLTFIPKWSVEIVRLIGDVLDALKVFEPIKQQIKKELTCLLKQIVYAATNITEDDIDRLIKLTTDLFKNPKLYLNNGILYPEKNITQYLDEDFGNYGIERDPMKQTFLAYDRCLNLCKMAILGADSLNQMLRPYYSGQPLFSRQQIEGGASTLQISIKTSGAAWAGTDDNVYFGVVLKSGEVLEIMLDKPGYNDFERKDFDTYTFVLPKTVLYSELKGFRLRKDYIHIDDDWKMQHLTVRDPQNKTVLYDAETSLWLKKRKHYFLSASIPSFKQEFSADGRVMSHLYSLDGAAPAGDPGYKPWNEPAFFLNETQDIREHILIPLFQLDHTPLAPSVIYCAHVQGKGWLSPVTAGETAGTTGECRQMEAVQIQLRNAPDLAKIQYSAHLASTGWTRYAENGQTAGTTGQARAMEAVKIRLANLPGWDVTYRVHMRSLGWSDWVLNDQTAGTTGQARPIEAIEIRLIPHA